MSSPARAAAPDSTDTVDVQAADRLIRRAFTEPGSVAYERVVDAYRRLLRSTDARLAEEERGIVNRHLRALAVILPDSLQRAVRQAVAAEAPAASGSVEDDLARRLILWWRGQDPLPSTRANERIEEHLRRAVYAWAHYRHEERLDDRGLIYLRLGPPYRSTEVGFDGARFRRKVLNRNPTLSSFEFRQGELWVYPHIDYAAHYLFIEQPDGAYQLGEPLELLPNRLRHGFPPSARGDRRAEAFVRALARAYRDLSLYHIAYSTVYQEAANYASSLDMAEFSGRPTPDLRRSPPSTFASTLTMTARQEAYRHERRRTDEVPRSYTGLRLRTETLPMEVRTARFMNPDGATRTEVYWSTTTDALHPSQSLWERLTNTGVEPAARYLLAVSATQWDARYDDRRAQHRRLMVDAAEPGLLAPQTFAASGSDELHHVALQWEVYMVFPEDDLNGHPRLGPRIQTAVFRADSLRPLSADPGRLVMSDLKPVLATDPTAAHDPQEARPYPYPTITPEAPLALYFEIYHLTYGDDDRAHYTVTYEVERRTERGLLRQLVQGEDVQRTSTSTQQTTGARTAQEYLLLDLSGAEPDAEGAVEITVRVTDETTGQQVARTLSFERAPTEE